MRKVRTGMLGLHPRQTRFRVALREVGKVINDRQRLFRSEGVLRILQTCARLIQIARGGLLGQRISRECLDLGLGLVDAVVVCRGRGAAREERSRDGYWN